jgi:tetratricopeptide (TPR) repeat protein
MGYFFQLIAVHLALSVALEATSGPDRLAEGNVLFDHGRYREAIAEYEGALMVAESPPNRADILYRLALAHGKLAELRAAEQCYKDALAIMRADGLSPRLALALGGLGEVYRAQHRLDDALATEMSAFRILRRLGMGETQQAAAVLTIMGGILYNEHRSKAAQQDLREALRILEKTVGPHHPDFALALNNLGTLEASRKNYAAAEELLTRALAIRESLFGPAHPLIAGTLLGLSSVYLQRNRYAEADGTCRRSLEMMTRFLPANHPDVIEAHISLALIAHRSGNSASALHVLEEAAALEEAVSSTNAQSSAVTGEYVQLLNLYSEYLGDACEKQKSRQFRLEAQQLGEQLGHRAPAGSTVTLTELEAGSLH